MKTRRDFPQVKYPPARRVDASDEFFGTRVEDPYRWLEDEGAEEVQTWIRAQDDLAQSVLTRLPEYDRALKWLEENWIEPPRSLSQKAGERRFWQSRPDGAKHDVIYMQEAEGEPQIVFDLNAGGAPNARLGMGNGPSPDGRHYLYTIAYDGADTNEIRIRDMETGQDLPEICPPTFTMYSATGWLLDGSGFYYGYLPWAALTGEAVDRVPGLYLHRLGQPFEEDEFILAHDTSQMRIMTGVVAEDVGLLLVQQLTATGARGGWGCLPLHGEKSEDRVEWFFPPDIEFRFAYVGTEGGEVFWITDYQAPNWQIVAMQASDRGLDKLRTVVSEQDEPLAMFGGTNVGAAKLAGGRLYLNTVHHNQSHLRVFDLQGKAQDDIQLPELVNLVGMELDADSGRGQLALDSFFHPTGIHDVDLATGEVTPNVVNVHAKHASYHQQRVFYDSEDGTRIPMTIMSKAGYEPNGDTPVLLYGYGGWGIPWLPRYSAGIPLWLELGGVYALANLRGGMEYGEAWHQAGQFFNKQNVFDDFCAAARFLVAQGHTRHEKIAIIGGSNGGLLTAACYNQHPELFGAVISQVAAIDLMRLWNTAVGATQTYELGAPNQSKEMAEYLLTYSPLQNVRHQGPYPPILNVVGETDPRCTPGHIYKYAAELQSLDDPDRLALLSILWGAGHGGNDRETRTAMEAEAVAFAWHMLH